MTTYGEQVAELEGLRDDIRKVGQWHGWDPSHERASEHLDVTMARPVLNRLWAALNRAARSIAQLAETNGKLERRNGQLAQANGALMVDRTRGIDEANERAQAACLWAAEVAEKAGVPQEEWPEQARATMAARWATQARLEAEVDRLERMRVTVLVPLINACEHAPEGFTGDQVKKLRRQLSSANEKAMGR